MFEAVHAHPDGESTVARMAATAASYGFEGLVVRNHGDAAAEFDADRIGRTYDVDVVDGVEIRAEDPAQASGFLGAHRSRNPVVVLHGGANGLNQFAVTQDRVDVLAHPMRGGDLNHVLVRQAADHGVRLEVNLSPVLRASGGRRVRALSGLRKLRELLEACDAPFVVSADPASHLSLRAPRELVVVGRAIGFEADAVREGLAEWGRIAATNRERLGEDYVGPGVRRGRYDAGPEEARGEPGGTDG